MLTGSCNCKGVTFTVKDGGQSVSACHCTQCRKQSGHHWASGYGDIESFEITGDVRWFAASETSKRGFCPRCGYFLFWKAHAEEGAYWDEAAQDDPDSAKAQACAKAASS